jgi:hypothetical protein
MAATTAGPRGRLLGAPKMSRITDPPTTPAPTATTMSSGPPWAAAMRKTIAMTTIAHPTRRQARLIHGDPSTTVETIPATKVELTSAPLTETASRSHSGWWTAASSSGVPRFFTMSSFSAEVRPWATRAARISIPNSRHRRRHSTTRPTPAGMSEAMPWKKR